MNGPGAIADIAQAQRLIQNTTGPVAHQSLRAGCWMLRTALEQAVRELLTSQGIAVGTATTRSVHLCLQAVYLETAPDLVRDVESAWDRLSQAVHHHAYELSPTYGEVHDLADAVLRIAEFAGRATGQGEPAHTLSAPGNNIALGVQ